MAYPTLRPNLSTCVRVRSVDWDAVIDQARKEKLPSRRYRGTRPSRTAAEIVPTGPAAAYGARVCDAVADRVTLANFHLPFARLVLGSWVESVAGAIVNRDRVSAPGCAARPAMSLRFGEGLPARSSNGRAIKGRS